MRHYTYQKQRGGIIVAVSTGPGGGGGSTGLYGPPLYQGTSPVSSNIFDWTDLPGNQWYLAEDGVYTAGIWQSTTPASQDTRVNDHLINHAPGGVFNGFTVIVARNPGSAILDLSYPGKNLGGGLFANGDLCFKDGSRGVLLCGFKYQNGQLQVDCPGIYTWYCTHTFPPSVWTAEPNFASITNYHHWGNRGHIFHANTTDFRSYGADATNISSIYYLENGTDHLLVQGAHGWALDNGNFYGNSGGDHGTHPDFIAYGDGGTDSISVLDSHINVGKLRGGIAGIVSGGGANGDCTLNKFQRLWIHGGSGPGLETGIDRTSGHSGVIYRAEGDHVYIWDCDDGNFIYWVDGAQVSFTPGVNSNAQASYLETGGGAVSTTTVGTDRSLIDPSSPDVVWRTANPYRSWSSLLFGVP